MEIRTPGPEPGAPPAGRPLRAHARRNRDALVAAAREAFDAGETDIRIEEIARRAGVGVGTLYRHFETRTAIVEAVYRERVDELCGSAPRLLAELDPYRALEAFFGQLVAHAAQSHGMAVALETVMSTGSPVFARARAAMVDAIALIMAAATEAGVIRPDVPPETVFRAMGGVCTGHDLPDWEEGATAVVRLLLDGLRPAAAPPR